MGFKLQCSERVERTRNVLLRAAGVVLLSATLGANAAQAGEVLNALPDGVAMDGFDVVAYFTAGEPKLGKPDHTIEYKGKTWRFRSAGNAAKFSADPERYAPAFNGWCSYAVSEGYGAEVDFVNGWAVIDGDLYLNWDGQTRDAFVDQHEKRIGQARQNWPRVRTGLRDGSVELYTHAGEGVGISHPQQPE